MAKLYDEKVQKAWKDLSAKVKSEGMTQSERWKRYNAVINEVLTDEALNAKYTEMARDANSESSYRWVPVGEAGSGDLQAIPSLYVHHLLWRQDLTTVSPVL